MFCSNEPTHLKALLQHLRHELTTIRKTLSPKSSRADIDRAIAAIATLHRELNVGKLLGDMPMTGVYTFKLTASHPYSADHEYRPSPDAAAMIELLDWSLDITAVPGRPTDQVAAWYEVVSETFQTWCLRPKITQALGREPHPQELDAICTALADGKLELEEVIGWYAA